MKQNESDRQFEPIKTYVRVKPVSEGQESTLEYNY